MVCLAVACPVVAVRTYDAVPCTCAAARVLSRGVTMCVGLCDKDASLREMDVVLAAMLVVCVRTVPSSRVRKIYLPCVYRAGPFFGAANNLR